MLFSLDGFQYLKTMTFINQQTFGMMTQQKRYSQQNQVKHVLMALSKKKLCTSLEVQADYVLVIGKQNKYSIIHQQISHTLNALILNAVILPRFRSLMLFHLHLCSTYLSLIKMSLTSYARVEFKAIHLLKRLLQIRNADQMSNTAVGIEQQTENSMQIMDIVFLKIESVFHKLFNYQMSILINHNYLWQHFLQMINLLN
ncbi:hypothetical protein TTHERM_000261889 (macronuclear) [Tetrahymena thermophila SB210]|uniref:Uncharacterized protein n=1 Tax=Tetrahymena thermophila (strain SB210) TaxID=312017 RepID=W7XLD6_TETTS|nr:hypothetical protein TTHERM_000261889 [Tetrahymena thermophila SB210]EWS76104.1 hypothetical protein TTHERM_000261889 [Tetrahymena thermophila SB210]|eukprot:XP_012651344.1 hypothetical protein TTHERM_000261889 [Tetrahymena thermophila SB210]